MQFEMPFVARMLPVAESIEDKVFKEEASGRAKVISSTRQRDCFTCVMMILNDEPGTA